MNQQSDSLAKFAGGQWQNQSGDFEIGQDGNVRLVSGQLDKCKHGWTKCEVCNFNLYPEAHKLPKLEIDPTNPPHYRQHPSGVECIEITRHMNFNLGNAIKYIWRAGFKSTNPVEVPAESHLVSE